MTTRVPSIVIEPTVRFATNPTITGTIESEPSSVSRTIVWTKALTRPRISSATWVPMIVSPVRNAMPANAPTSITAAMARNRCGASATSTSARPAATMPAPKRRLCGMRRAIRGAAPIPMAKPMKTDANSTP